MAVMERTTEILPALPLDEWRATQETLHLWTQVVGKVKLELTPFLNEWWNVAFAITPRGLTTGPIPTGSGAFAVDFDFVDHTLFVRTNDGLVRSSPLAPRSVAAFYAEFLATLRGIGVTVAINPMPVEIPRAISLEIDTEHAAYDPEFTSRWWRIMLQTEKALQRFRTPFAGKSSPIHFFWGSFDLGHTRFSGRPASPPSSWPRFLQIAEERENYACGFWPGTATLSGVELGEPAFYAYSFPAPAGFSEAAVRPAGAYYDRNLGEFLLRYDDVRRADDPEQAILEFFRSTYEAAATLGDWDRSALELAAPERVNR
jgi:hypothetical protein